MDNEPAARRAVLLKDKDIGGHSQLKGVQHGRQTGVRLGMGGQVAGRRVPMPLRVKGPWWKLNDMDRFTSAGLPVAGRQAAYEAAMRCYFGDEYVDKHIQLDIGQPENFLASMDPIVLGHVRGGIHTSNAPHRMFLTPGDVISADLDFYFVLGGEVAFDGDSGLVHLRAGDMALLRTSEPVSSVSSQMEMIGLHIPERLLRGRLDDRPLALNQTLSGLVGLGACLSSLLRTAAMRGNELSVEDGLILQSSVVDTVLHAASVDRDPADSTLRQQQSKIRLIKRTALGRLQDPEFTPQQLADDSGVSVRTLHRLFHSSGATFRDWLRERRLERCWEELNDPAPSRRNVAGVAFRWGFNDLTTFNRSFKIKYGVSPTSARLTRAAKND